MRSRFSLTRAAAQALLIVLSLAGMSSSVDAEWLACSTIQPGDTVARVATRITGDARYRHSARFQIVDPATGRTIPKSRYNRIQAGWQACVQQVPLVVASHQPLATSSSPRDPAVFLVFGVGLVGAVVTARIVHRVYFSDRQRTLDVMTAFGTRFVREFERPLIQPVPAPQRIHSRLRARPQRKRLDILLAPSGKGRYPNLADHKDNVLYDIVRVVRLLRDRSFSCGLPYAEGEWVVVPFQFKGWSEQAGGQ